MLHKTRNNYILQGVAARNPAHAPIHFHRRPFFLGLRNLRVQLGQLFAQHRLVSVQCVGVHIRNVPWPHGKEKDRAPSGPSRRRWTGGAAGPTMLNPWHGKTGRRPVAPTG